MSVLEVSTAADKSYRGKKPVTIDNQLNNKNKLNLYYLIIIRYGVNYNMC